MLSDIESNTSYLEERRDKKLKSEAVMLFADNIIGAFESGFLESTSLTLSEIHRMAQNHIKDNYQAEAQTLEQAWGKELVKQLKDLNDE